MKFELSERKNAVMSILQVLRDRVAREHLHVSFENMDFLKQGFGIKMILQAEAGHVDEYYEVKNFLADMLNYIFNGQVDVTIITEDGELKAEFQVVSKI